MMRYFNAATSSILLLATLTEQTLYAAQIQEQVFAYPPFPQQCSCREGEHCTRLERTVVDVLPLFAE